ncbi:hypothetical protein Pcinc_035421 [Petrolisthes cinctipes]|uniref:Uncharacterized protein n=1 Tax=Petrolisthes cinctipes TaxID=88211 RepID=A0AAE1EPF4_PETCI|nr:hypothetical protein Pcinc_035421 [Petrolisthes cinctipes]
MSRVNGHDSTTCSSVCTAPQRPSCSITSRRPRLRQFQRPVSIVSLQCPPYGARPLVIGHSSPLLSTFAGRISFVSGALEISVAGNRAPHNRRPYTLSSVHQGAS